jgi:hypothetical protein
MKKTGTVESLNVSPRGFYEGFLLKTDKGIVQINLPQPESGAFGESLNPGGRVTAEVEPGEPRGEGPHEVYHLVHLLDAKGHVASGQTHGARNFAGSIARLNYALHGEVNGAILDSGDFLHLKPEGALALHLEVGMEVKGHGAAKPMVGGHSVIEAEEVNGIAIAHPKAGRHAIKHAGH